MAIDPASGMDLDELYLDGQAAHDVANKFREFSRKLEEIRENFDKFQPDLGMGDCAEGRSWNSKMEHARESALNQLTDFIRRSDDFADKADAAQTAIDGQEKRNAGQFVPVDGKQAYPPYQ